MDSPIPEQGTLPGRVALVGAGPGDPGWITVRGLDLLRRADVVVYDALANPALLNEAPPESEKIDVGKRAKRHTLSQDAINALLVEKAAGGRLVVRLKGGDPYLFGRGAEEAAYVSAHGLTCEVVPGITSGLAAPLAAGIPVTHRELASTVTLVTGHEDPSKGATAIDYRALAGLVRAGGTACFYMGVGRLAAIAAELNAGGLPLETPVAAVQWGGSPRQRSVRATLGELAGKVEATGIGAPAIIVVGRVAGLDEGGLDFYTRRPLFGCRVLVTRTRHQASELGARLTELGAEVIEAPTVDLVAPADLRPVDEAIRDIAAFDWLVLTSGNGVTGLRERLDTQGLDARQLAGVRVAAIGDATAAQLRRELGIRADLVPARFVAESLAAELIKREGTAGAEGSGPERGAGDLAGKRFLLLRADLARPALPRLLIAAGAAVVEHAIYETRLAASLPERALAALRAADVDWVTFTSASTANNLVALLGPERALLDRVRTASIGPITSAALSELGLSVDAQAERSDVESLVAAMVRVRESLPVAAARG